MLTLKTILTILLLSAIDSPAFFLPGNRLFEFHFSTSARQKVANQQPSIPSSPLIGKVTSVDDGKTLLVLVDNKKLRVRIFAIDVPRQALRNESRKNLSLLAKDKTVELLIVSPASSSTKSDSIPAKVLINNRDIGLEQIRSGLAWYIKEPEQYQSTEDMLIYQQEEKKAEKAKLGVWSDSYKRCKGSGGPSVGEVKEVDWGAEMKPRVVGTVIVEIMISESGDVIEARALCGHPILQGVAVDKVREFKFEPQANRIIGTIVFNFVP